MVYFSFPLHCFYRSALRQAQGPLRVKVVELVETPTFLMEQSFNSGDTGRKGQHHHLVVGLDLEVVGGNEALAVAGDAADDGIGGHGQLPDGLARDRRARPNFKLHDVGIDSAEALQRGDLGA